MQTLLVFHKKRCLACKSCELACAVARSESRTLAGALAEGRAPRRRIFIRTSRRGLVAARCLQCKKPECVEACASGALTRDAETGLVVFDPDRCEGALRCVAACPHDGIRADPDTGRPLRCDLCAHLGSPACVDACPTGGLQVRSRT